MTATAHTILVVDNNPDDRWLLRRSLARGGAGYVIVEATTGAEALAICRAQPISCIVLDYLIPDLNGVQFLAALAADERTQGIPVMMITGVGDDTIAVQALKAGAQEYLVKDRSTPEVLCRTVASVIERSTLLRQVAAQQREVELREVMFRTSVETMLDCFGVYAALRDEAGRIVDFRVEYINDAACATHRLTRTQQVGQPLCASLPGHRVSGLFEAYCRVVETGEPLEQEALLYDDGYAGQEPARAFEIRAGKWGDGVVAAWRDISERRRAELERAQLLERERLARQAAEEAAARLAQIQRLTAALSAATSVQQVLEVMTVQSRLALSAASVAVAVLAEDGLMIELAPGLPPPRGHEPLSIMAPLPVADAMRRNQLLVFETRAELLARYPLLAIAAEHTVGEVGAVIPLAVDRRVLGALVIGFASGRQVAPEVRGLLTTVGQICAQALDRARRYESEREARAHLARRIADQQQAEMALRESEARYRALAGATAQIIWHATATGSLSFVDQAWEALTGQDHEACAGWGWTDVIHPDELASVVKLWLLALRTETAHSDRLRVRRHDGTYRTLLMRGTPVRGADGRLREWVGAMTDVTEDLRREAASQLLIDAGALLSAPLQFEARLNALAELLVPSFADWCALDLRTEEEGFRTLVVRHRNPEQEPLVRQLAERHSSLDPANLLVGMPTGLPLLMPVVSDALLVAAAQDDEHLRLMRALGPASSLVVSLTARERVLGTLALTRAAPASPYDQQDLALAEELARRAALAFDNARLFAQARHAAATEERRRLAAKLHNSVSQALLAANRTAEILPQLWELDPAAGHQALGDLQLFAASALAEMRALLVELHPRILVSRPLHEALASLVASIFARSPTVVVTALAPMPLLPPAPQMAIYSIAQEALNNALRHAAFSSLSVTLAPKPPLGPGALWNGSVTLTIADDGRGFLPDHVAPGGLGLTIMGERAAEIGASLAVESAPGAGTRVTLIWCGAAVDAPPQADHKPASAVQKGP